jgi:protein SCO1/2
MKKSRSVPSCSRRTCRGPHVWVGIVALLIGTATLDSAHGQRKEAPPEDLMEVGVTEHLNDAIPLDLQFVDSKGLPVTLAEYFDGELPVVLTLNYSSCPMLCSLQLDGLFDGLKKMKWDLGDKYRMVTVSIDPKESPDRAQMTRKKYLQYYGRAGCGDGYACLVGKNEQITQLADTVGFHYRYVPKTGEYAHTAVTMICTPDGRLSRYLYGVEYDPQTLRLSLLEASQGKIGTPMEQLFLFCFQYDAASGRYGPSAFKLMRLGGILTVIGIGVVLLVYWRRESVKTPKNELVKAI